jgi:subtilisin family serine protease
MPIHSITRLVLTGVLIFVTLVSPAASYAPPDAPQTPSAPLAEFAPNLWPELAKADGRVDILVTLKLQADLSPAARLQTHQAKTRFVRDALWATAEASQVDLRAWLRARGVNFKPYYIANAMRVEAADKALILALAARADVARIAADPAFRLPEEAQAELTVTVPLTVEWNIQRTFAPVVWGMGYTGQNVVVASHDSGVEWQHPALINQYRGWDGATADHDYNWHDPFGDFQEPHGAGSHGTHTTGTMVGDDGLGNQIGMAPGAEWIACKNQDVAGLFKASVYMECFEWFIAPYPVGGDPSQGDPTKAPHVINNSWTCTPDEGCDPDTLRSTVDAVLAAGIVIAKSAGNTGPACGSITVPGAHPDILATGAFDINNNIASFSSRGPVTFDGEQLIKPNIASPGAGIRSATGTSGYGNMSGTSMASPHTAGLVALLLSFRTDFKGHPDRVKQLVEISADGTTASQTCGGVPGSARPNNTFGWGRINAAVMFGNGTETGTGTLNGTVTSGGAPVAGATVQVVHQASGWWRRLTTDANGAYSIMLLAGNWTVTASRYGLSPQSANVAITNLGTTTQDFTLSAAPLWTLSGTVHDASNNAPLPAQVQLDRTPVSLLTNPATGDFSGQVAEGVYTLRVSSTGYTATQQVITVTQNLNLGTLLLQPKAAYVAGCASAFNWIDATDGTLINLNDDANRQITLAAPFVYHGISYTRLHIQADGFISFNNTGYDSPWGNWIPAIHAPNNAIYAFWADLNPNNGAQGQVYTKTLTSPTRTVIEWYQVQHWPSGNPETFEIVLNHQTGTIALQYQTVADASLATAGLEDRTGTDGVRISYHQTDVLQAGRAFTMYPVMGRPTTIYDPCALYLPAVLRGP